ncbi:hypothetical protein [Streptomyces sioyaensis]|uniref:hypothetical protein n=1 Tax=Streptomyces sioyaensis TaxID=67364 RepID=UPI0036E37B4B
MLVRRLPDPVSPARRQIGASYTNRLAPYQRPLVQVTEREKSGGMRRVVIPELRDPQPDWAMFRHTPQTSCHRCDARHPGGQVTRLLLHHRYVCLRRRAWIDPPDLDHPAVDLPDVVNAQRKHPRTLSRYG